MLTLSIFFNGNAADGTTPAARFALMLIHRPRVEPMGIEPVAKIDCSSFQQFVLAYETAVFTFCYRMLGNAEMAENVAEKAFLEIYRDFPAVSLVTVLSVARCGCHEKIADVEQFAAADGTQNQYLFSKLTIPEREAMALRYGCKLSFVEIVAILNTSCEAVRATVHQGRWRAAGLQQIQSADHPLIKQMEPA